MKGARIKFGVIIVSAALALWSLVPTYRLYFMMPGQEKALNDKLARALSADDSARVKVEIAEFQQQKTAVHKRALHLGLDLVGGMYLTLQVDKSKLTAEDAKDAGDRALEVIRNRVDQFGVMEPIIQKAGNDRILVQLPGVDQERAKTLIGQTAQLKFQLVQDERTTYDALKTIDDKLKAAPGTDTGGAARPDTTRKVKSDTSRLQALLDTTRKDTGLKAAGEAEAGTLLGLVRTIGSDFGVDDNEYPQFKMLLERGRPYWPQGYEFRFGPSEAVEGSAVRRLYMLKAEPEMLGSAIKDARPAPYNGSEPGLTNTWIVSLRLGRKDAAVFAQVTGRNIGRRLAIVLDDIVKSAPTIQTRIPDGNAMITTNDVNPDNSRDLAIVLRSGALPAPVNIVEERSVGASLGSDAIRRGIFAGLVGSIVVVVFMLLYYSVGGLLADWAMFMDILFLLAVLAGLRATMSLPGLAGIALTVGMAVDTNVLIFERIREELRWGKTVMAAVDAGYDRVFMTVIDTHVTTIITAIALYFIGSGYIRGFAINLTVGLIINVVTAVFMTRWVLDWYLARFEVKKLRI
ncbi:MAG TPA: protein translocase subunit SecD [bacterium]|nr:protein translocase subunit SecD [bacterium]